MSNPSLSIIIPTYNRPHLLPRAVSSALAQTVEDIEIIVVDDGSPEPVKLREHPRLQLIRLEKNSGGSVARNVGAKEARGRYISYLDDDDQLLPQMAQVSLEALASTTLPKPVAVLSGLEVLRNGRVIRKRIPPTLERGSHFCLEEIEPGQSFHTKQTMVVERDVLLSIGGFDETFTSRVHTELFLRLNPVCSLLGLPTVTYRLYKHEGQQVSSSPSLRQLNFERLLCKHKSLFEAHPKMFANFIFEHAMTLHKLGQTPAALKSISWAMSIDPLHTFARITSPFKSRLMRRVTFW